MKTASKFLSMLLLVALCLSLMGGSAYALAPLGEQEMPTALAPVAGSDVASDSNAGGLATLDLGDGEIDTYTSGTELNSLDVMPLVDAYLIWNAKYSTLQEALNGNETSIWLHEQAGTNGEVHEGATSIGRSVTIDLKNKTIYFDSALAINANVTFKNGTIKNASNITVAKNCKLTLENITNADDVKTWAGGEGTVDGTIAINEGYIATIGSERFATVEKALARAAELGGTVTINFVNDPSKLENITINNWPSTLNANVILNLNNNCLEGNIEVYNSLTINGGRFSGGITAQADLTLKNTSVDEVVAAGHTLTISNSTVGFVSLQGATLTMGSGTIGELQVNDTSGGQTTLDVRGGYVKAFELISGSAKRAVTGGEWYVDDATSVEYLKNCVASNYSLKGSSSPYTVGNGSGTVNPGNPGNSGVDGNYYYNVVGSPYTRNSNGGVYVELSSLSSTNYWISTDYNANGATIISSGNYTLTNYSNGIYNYRLTFNNSYLNSLSNGTYYLFGQDSGKNTVRLGSFTVQGDGSTVIPGTAAVWPVDNTWYSGSGMYYFYVTPSLQLVSGGTYDYYDVKIDGMQIGGDKISYNGYQKFGVASSVMDTLAIGTHSITVQTTAGTATGSFRVGATLRPVDTDKHVIGSSKNLQFVCSEAISRVWVGNTEITNNYGDYYTLSNSRKTITLSAGFLNNRTAGQTYTITVQTDGGYTPSSTFQILTTAQASSSPRTGDESNLALWAAVLIISGGAAVAVLPRLKKHED